MGLEHYLARIGLTLTRTNVGDRNVVEHMRSYGFNIGGEQSGHIILSDYVTTGDGIIAGLQILAYLREADGKNSRKFSQYSKLFTPMPQILRNVRYGGASPLANEKVKVAVKQASKNLSENGRLFVRESGTEPLIRIMAEGTDAKEITKITNELVKIITENSQ
jgi:phosphoglucosamine mutase